MMRVHLRGEDDCAGSHVVNSVGLISRSASVKWASFLLDVVFFTKEGNQGLQG